MEVIEGWFDSLWDLLIGIFLWTFIVLVIFGFWLNAHTGFRDRSGPSDDAFYDELQKKIEKRREADRLLINKQKEREAKKNQTKSNNT